MTIGSWIRATVVTGAAVAGLASASSPGKAHEVKRTTEIGGSYDNVWAAVIDVFADRNWAIDKMEKDSGLITTDWMNMGSEADTYADCGSSGMATVISTQIRFNVRVRGDVPEDPTTITVNTSFRRTLAFGDSRNTIDCNSKGTVETMIQDEVASRTKRTKKKAVEVPASAPAPAVDAGVEVDAQ